MATAPANDVAPEPVVAGEIIILDPAEIALGERLREIDRLHAEALGWSMMKDGQIYPVEVCRMPGKPGWHLAGPGGHRLTGAQMVGMDGIEARVVSAGRESRDLREAVENIFRKDPDPIERAAAIAQLVRVKRARAGLAEAAHRTASVPANLKRDAATEAGTTLETISNVYGWSEELGAELGFTGRTIRNDLLLYRGLKPSLVTELRAARHPVLRNASQLRALAKLSPDDQARAVRGLVAGEVRTATEALRAIRGRPAADPAAKRLSAFQGAFARMSLAERKAAVAWLLPQAPAGSLPEAAPAGPTLLERYQYEQIAEAMNDARFYHGLTRPAADSPALDRWREAGDRLGVAESCADRLVQALDAEPSA